MERLQDSTHKYSCSFYESPLRWVIVNSNLYDLGEQLTANSLFIVSKKVLSLRWVEILKAMAKTHLDTDPEFASQTLSPATRVNIQRLVDKDTWLFIHREVEVDNEPVLLLSFSGWKRCSERLECVCCFRSLSVSYLGAEFNPIQNHQPFCYFSPR